MKIFNFFKIPGIYDFKLFKKLLIGIMISIILITLLLTRLYSILDVRNSGDNAIIIERALRSYINSIDRFYWDEINAPMEKLIDSSIIVGYSFTTLEYPPGDDLLAAIDMELKEIITSSSYINDICIYTSTLNDFVRPAGTGKYVLSDDEYRKLIYDYNSKQISHSQIGYHKYYASSISLDNRLFICMDITPASGQAHSTLFVEIDKKSISNYIFNSIENSKEYDIAVYDSGNNLLLANYSINNETETYTLSQLKASSDPYIVTASKYILYLSSSVLNWQYVFEVQRGLGTLTVTSSIIYLCIVVFIVLGMTIVTSLLFIRIFLVPISKENATMREIIHRTSNDSITMMFSRLISGQPIDEDYIRITLEVTNQGFEYNGTYATGFIEYTGNKELSLEERHRILHMINNVLERFSQKNACPAHAHFADNFSYYVVISFPQETSAAKGKLLIKELSELLTNYPEAYNYPLFVSFGHMYKSVQDVVYSYNEAMRTRRVVYLNSNETTSVNEESSIEPAKSEIVLEKDFSSILERRANQIAETLFNENEESVHSLISRTINDINDENDFKLNIKQFITALSENMISYPFVNLTTISSVTENLEKELAIQSERDILMELLETSISTLCNEFSECLKKQRNPYILAAQSYIESHYTNSYLSLEEIATELKIAPNYLSALFSKNLGKKLFEYITEYRLDRAIDMLHNTSLSINEISEKSGFGSSRNFIRIFKKYKDTTPGAYRKAHLQNKGE